MMRSDKVKERKKEEDVGYVAAAAATTTSDSPETPFRSGAILNHVRITDISAVDRRQRERRPKYPIMT